MDVKKLAIGTVGGGVVMWALGYLIFQTLMADFYASNAGSAQGVARETPLLWAVILGTLALAKLLTFALIWSGASSIAEGFKIGAIVGFLVWFGVDFIFYGSQNVSNLTLAIVDPMLEIVRTGLSGAFIAFLLAKFGGTADA
jgi:hypothetical protein